MDTIDVKGGSVVLLKDSLIEVRSDTVFILPDTLRFEVVKDQAVEEFYDTLKKKSEKSKVTKELYDLLVRRDGDKKKEAEEEAGKFVKSESFFSAYEGKVIRSISFYKVPILEGSVFDTTIVASSGIAKLANNIHVNTLDHILKNNLFIKSGEKLDAYRVSDNERVIRNLNYIEDAKIWVIKTGSKDSVDLVVATKDKFSIGFSASASGWQDYSVRVYDRNVVGTGRDLSYEFSYDEGEDPPFGHQVRLFANNIAGTFTDGLVNYINSANEDRLTLSLKKEYLTPQTKYAGEIIYEDIKTFRTELDADTLKEQVFSEKVYDVWVGRSFNFGEVSRRTSINLGIRYRYDNFMDRPFVASDSNNYYHDRKLYLGNVFFNNIVFFKTSKLLGFGRTEDISAGVRYGFTLGYEKSEFEDRPYVGFSLLGAKYSPRLGYFSFSFDAGGFFKPSWRDGAIRFNSTIFTNLKDIKRTQLRHIFKLNYLLGFNRSGRDDLIRLDDLLRGFNSNGFEGGPNRLATSWEGVIFMPWNWIGFKFAFFTYADFGFVDQDKVFFTLDNLRAAFGMGVRLRNESLVFNTFSLTLGWIPIVDDGNSHFHIDVSGSDPVLFDQIRDARPNIVPYE
ncbi:hypothetical protein V6R21_16115 [Limibacter armeniacum]|uniref:hypothetical protein n=1 Tax=Limibacter armeniacum TaxID=466084 RepID=UPI002FE56773